MLSSMVALPVEEAKKLVVISQILPLLNPTTCQTHIVDAHFPARRAVCRRLSPALVTSARHPLWHRPGRGGYGGHETLKLTDRTDFCGMESGQRSASKSALSKIFIRLDVGPSGSHSGYEVVMIGVLNGPKAGFSSRSLVSPRGQSGVRQAPPRGAES